MAKPKPPVPVDPHSAEHVVILAKLYGGVAGISPLVKAGRNIDVDINPVEGSYTVHGKAAGGPASAFNLTLYDITESYVVGDYAWVQATNTITTTGAVYPPTGLTALSVAGLWLCIKDAPEGYFPVAPYPSPDDPTAANMYWLFLGNLHCV